MKIKRITILKNPEAYFVDQYIRAGLLTLIGLKGNNQNANSFINCIYFIFFCIKPKNKMPVSSKIYAQENIHTVTEKKDKQNIPQPIKILVSHSFFLSKYCLYE